MTSATIGSTRSHSKKASQWSRAYPTPSASPESATVHQRIAAASGAMRSCWPFWPIPPTPNTPNGSTGSARSSTRTSSICNTPTPCSPPGSPKNSRRPISHPVTKRWDVSNYDPVELFSEYLESCALGEADEAELLADLVVELGDLKVDSNGGDREAREKIQAIYDLLDNAIEGRSLHPIDMMMTGKIFTDAGWAVPDSLKQAVAEALRTAAPDTQGVAGSDAVSSLLEVAYQAGQNPFDVYEWVNSLLA